MRELADPTRLRHHARFSVGVVGLAVGLLVAVGCGPSENHTALALDDPQWVTDSADAEGPSLRFETECADLAETSVEPGAGIDGVPLITVWGRPLVGGCLTDVVVTVPAGTTRVEDAATGMVVDLPIH